MQNINGTHNEQLHHNYFQTIKLIKLVSVKMKYSGCRLVLTLLARNSVFSYLVEISQKVTSNFLFK